MSFTVIRPTQRKSSSTTINFSIRCRCSSLLASSMSIASRTVTKFSLVISESTGSLLSVANRTSRLVKMPTNFLLSDSTTGIPEILCNSINFSASARVPLGEIVTGLITIPDSNFFTFRTSSACSSLVKFL